MALNREVHEVGSHKDKLTKKDLNKVQISSWSCG
jgi:hypothetical protein